MDHVEHDEHQKQAGCPARGGATLRRELGEQQCDRSEDCRDQREVQAVRDRGDQADVHVRLLGAGKREQPDQHRHEDQPAPHRRHFFNHHPEATSRQRQQHVHGAALFLAPEHGALREDRPERHDKHGEPVLPGRVTAGRVDLDRVGEPGEGRSERNDRSSRRGGRQERGHGGKHRSHQKSKAETPTQDRDAEVPQGFQVDAAKPHRQPLGAPSRRSHRSAGKRLRDSARSW